MRVTDRMFYDLSRSRLGTARQTYLEKQEQALTNRRVAAPSDDPVATALARKHKAQEERASSYQRAINFGFNALQIAESALEHVSELLRQARELAIQAANDTVSTDQRAQMAVEVNGLREQLVALANTESGGEYVFGGSRTGSTPFALDGTYLGDANVREIETAPGTRVPVGVPGNEAFGAAGGVDVFAALEGLRRALETNDELAIRDATAAIDRGDAQVVRARAVLGSHTEAIALARTVAERTQDASIAEQTALVGISPTDALLAVEQARSALETAVEIAAQLPPPGLASGRR